MEEDLAFSPFDSDSPGYIDLTPVNGAVPFMLGDLSVITVIHNKHITSFGSD